MDTQSLLATIHNTQWKERTALALVLFNLLSVSSSSVLPDFVVNFVLPIGIVCDQCFQVNKRQGEIGSTRKPCESQIHEHSSKATEIQGDENGNYHCSAGVFQFADYIEHTLPAVLCSTG